MEVHYQDVNSRPMVIHKAWVKTLCSSKPVIIRKLLVTNSCSSKPVVIRKVWAKNLSFEFTLIGRLIGQYSFIAMDTEFPGQISRPNDHRNLNPSDTYKYLKENVDALNIIQVGLTLSDEDGNLPDLGTPYRFIWEFNFNDFNLARGDKHATDSINLLRNHGINFEYHAAYGIRSRDFSELMHFYRLVCNDAVTWITFHGGYDFGYLAKILTNRKEKLLPIKEEEKLLPTKLEEFLQNVKELFGNHVYDIKHMIRCCYPLRGGLEQVAQALNLNRSVGECHQAGSDSLLTSQVFHQLLYVTKLLSVKSYNVP